MQLIQKAFLEPRDVAYMHYCLHEAGTKVTAPSMMPGITFVDIKYILRCFLLGLFGLHSYVHVFQNILTLLAAVRSSAPKYTLEPMFFHQGSANSRVVCSVS